MLGGGNGGDAGRGSEGGGKDGDGGAKGEHAPKPIQAIRYEPSNAALPAHAQRMRTLFASDKASAFCRELNGG